MRSALRFLAATMVLTIACSRPADTVRREGVPRAAAPASVDSRALAPFAVSLEEESTSAGRATLVARIERRSLLEQPLKARLQVPPGVELSGPREFEVPTRTSPGTFEQRYVLQFSRVPDTDLVLLVDATSEDFGFHAASAYTFGRKPAEPIAPQANGPAVQVGPHSFGNSVPVQQ